MNRASCLNFLMTGFNPYGVVFPLLSCFYNILNALRARVFSRIEVIEKEIGLITALQLGYCKHSACC